MEIFKYFFNIKIWSFKISVFTSCLKVSSLRPMISALPDKMKFVSLNTRGSLCGCVVFQNFPHKKKNQILLLSLRKFSLVNVYKKGRYLYSPFSLSLPICLSIDIQEGYSQFDSRLLAVCL